MLRECLRHAWNRTFRDFGGASFLYTILAIPIVGFGLHYLLAGRQPMADEFHVWLIYGLAAAGLVFSTIFLWNLACAPYRIERDRRMALEAQVARFEAIANRKGLARGIAWRDWSIRSRFTILEVAYLLAGIEPRQAPAEGPVLAHLSELIWAVQDGKLQTIWTRPEDETGAVRLAEHLGKLRHILGPREVSEAEMIEARVLRNYLAGRLDEPARRVLANLGEVAAPQSLPET